MGKYINPPNMTKERFLELNGVHCPFEPTWEQVTTCDSFPVCLVDNGEFKAAAIIDTEEELKRFSDPIDPRSKLWFMVHRDDLKPYLE